MIVKVCGMRQQENLDNVVNLGVDMVGFNFYPSSSRYVVDVVKTPPQTKRVGVFVNENLDKVFALAESHKLDYIQLHGNETQEYITEVAKSYPVIKAIGIEDSNDFKMVNELYDVTYFLLDKKSKLWGGTGKKFQWSLLENYASEVPFLLAGGIGPEDVDVVKQMVHPQFMGVDLNSRFESVAAVKDEQELKKFIKELRS